MPLFVSWFELDPQQVHFTPNEEEFQSGIAEIVRAFQQAAMQNDNLVADSFFDAFTRSASYLSRLTIVSGL